MGWFGWGELWRTNNLPLKSWNSETSKIQLREHFGPIVAVIQTSYLFLQSKIGFSSTTTKVIQSTYPVALLYFTYHAKFNGRKNHTITLRAAKPTKESTSPRLKYNWQWKWFIYQSKLFGTLKLQTRISNFVFLLDFCLRHHIYRMVFSSTNCPAMRTRIKNKKELWTKNNKISQFADCRSNACTALHVCLNDPKLSFLQKT